MHMYLVDAFTDKPYRGNPAAVCVLEAEQPNEWMQRVANEMHASETAFLLKQGEGYSLRWFTPVAEVDLCGHATLASAHLLWEERLFTGPQLKFYTKSGLLTALRNGDWIELDFPLEPPSVCEPHSELVQGLGIPYRYMGKNRMDFLIEVDDEEAVRGLQPNFYLWKKVPSRGIIVTSATKRPGIDFVSRCFYPALGVDEDPVTA